MSGSCLVQGMFNDDAFSKMKKGARIVNVARGGVIDEAALARALDNGQVAQVKNSRSAREFTHTCQFRVRHVQCSEMASLTVFKTGCGAVFRKGLQGAVERQLPNLFRSSQDL